jgi:mannose-1-phosphate guanylyltransferase
LIVPSARPGPPGESLVLDGARVHPSARLYGGTSVLPGAEVGPDCVLEGAVVMPDAVLGTGCRVRSSAIGPRARLDDEVVLDHAVVGSGAHVGSGNELRRGARLSCDLDLPAEAIRF